MKRINAFVALVFFIAALLFTGCSKRPAGARYYNKEDGYSMLFPKEWEEKEKFMGSSVLVLSPCKGEKDKFQENMSVIVEDVGDDFDLNDYVDLQMKKQKAILDKLHIRKSGNVKIDSVNGYWAEIDHENGPMKFKILYYVALNKGRGYIISCVSEADVYPEYKEEFQKVMKSFTFDED